MKSQTFSARRFWIANFFILTLFLVVIYQLFQLTIIRRPALLAQANKQHLLSVDIPPVRGEIVDRHNNELAINLKVPSIYAVPRILDAPAREALVPKVAKILQLDPAYVRARLTRDKAFIWLKRRATHAEADQIRELETPGLGLLEEYRRFYPQGDLLSHVIGFSNIDNQGLEGIELSLNRDLQGRAGFRTTKRDAMGREVRAFEIKSRPAVDGNRVTLTIDHYIQYLTERALDQAFKTWKAKGAWAVVMEAKTGKIVAIATRPNFDPNNHGLSTVDARRNRVVTDMYEPGSVFKIIAASAALNEGKVSPETIFNCENGAYRYGSRTLHDVHPYGKLTFEEVIIKSSNIGTVKIAALLEPETFYRYIQLFGIGRSTGVDLPGEAPGFVRAPAQWSKTSPYNIPMGQEVMVTALQMNTALAVIANGGYLVRPYIVAKVEDQAGVVLREKQPLVRHRVISEGTSDLMRRVLRRVVEEGTGKKAMIPGIPVAGKTGTAQKILPGGRGYSHSNFMSSFIGFAPADDPKLVMTIVFDDPHPLYYGGTVAAPVFKEVMEPALLSMGYVPQNASTLEEVNGRQELRESPPKIVPAQAAGTRF